MLICGVQLELSSLSFLLYQSYMWKNSPDINNYFYFPLLGKCKRFGWWKSRGWFFGVILKVVLWWNCHLTLPTMPNNKPWLWWEVQLFELWILDTIIAHHYSIKKFPSSKGKVGLRENVTSSNQDIKTNVQSTCCVVLIGLRHKKTADTNNTGPTIWRFE